MIINLDDSLIEYCGLETNNPSHIQLFELFTEVKNRGFHFILASRRLLEILGNQDNLSLKAKSSYRRLFSNYSIESSILNKVDFIISISNRPSEKNQAVTNLNIDELDPNSFLSRGKLLLENTTDADIYKRITAYYKQNIGLNDVEYKWEVCNGGGSTSVQEFQRFLNEKLTYTSAILDSDQISPFSEIGSTAKAFKKKFENPEFGDFQILEVHEMENLYPPQLVAGMCQVNVSYRINLVNFEKIIRDKSCNSTHFLDYKNGLSTCSIGKMKEEERTYWTTILTKLNIKIKKCSCNKAKCDRPILIPFGRHFGRNLVTHIQDIGVDISHLLTENFKVIWMRIGKFLFERFCCPRFSVII